ncbi:MAG: hypothetical protein A3J93_04700 [Candidatus Magasanikbacteria bacterium RIFOXYC2_FULL_42_28]|uniref:Uncharacterized protein n=1 Tax=Candidatus Magasanikbacteria bacterium RIFOXYC2_FULL_42_28 TaxID=1798704 RepID=A0A1F6NWM1_9BACT|nr:MAG: hypothetical protein A3J93_04700 [Candidatus Magasanikbacteria bacterium RIFOXYC2_FULL_42_28]
MEKQGYKMPRLEEKMGELKNYLRFHKPNQNSALMSRAYDKMVILPLATLARSLLNWELDGKNITPEYTLALLMLIKQKISDARVRHNAKIPPPDMI